MVMHDDIMPAGGQCCESFDDVARSSAVIFTEALFTYTISIFIFVGLISSTLAVLFPKKSFAISSRKLNFILLLIKRSRYINNLMFV